MMCLFMTIGRPDGTWDNHRHNTLPCVATGWSCLSYQYLSLRRAATSHVVPDLSHLPSSCISLYPFFDQTDQRVNLIPYAATNVLGFASLPSLIALSYYLEHHAVRTYFSHNLQQPAFGGQFCRNFFSLSLICFTFAWMTATTLILCSSRIRIGSTGIPCRLRLVGFGHTMFAQLGGFLRHVKTCRRLGRGIPVALALWLLGVQSLI